MVNDELLKKWAYVNCSKYRVKVLEYLDSVDYDEYKSTTTTWKKNPSAMIRKVAEKEACRQSAGISGLHIPEEMGDEFNFESTEEDYKKKRTRELKMAQKDAQSDMDEEDVEVIDVNVDENIEEETENEE